MKLTKLPVKKVFFSFASKALIVAVIASNAAVAGVFAYENKGNNLEQARIQTLFDSGGKLINKTGVDSNNIKSLLIDKIKKENLSEPKKKLGADLLKLIDDSFLLSNQNRTQVISQMKESKQFIAKEDSVKTINRAMTNQEHNDLVYVYVSFKTTARTSVIDPVAWKVTDRDEQNHLAVALVEVNKLEELAGLSEVKSIRSVMPPVTQSGSVVTEGDMIHQSDEVRSIYSQGGAGIKIGVISDGVDNIALSQGTGDLPAGVTVISNSEGGDEGTAMLEIIHDMAPNASLYFHDSGSNIIAFNSAIDDLITAGVNVIVDDIGWIGEPFFEDGIVALHVADVLADNNIVYVSSAGNSAQKHYQGDYYNDGHDSHDFSRGSDPTYKYLYVGIPSGQSIRMVLQWDDSFGSSGNDYDLYLANLNTGELIAGSVESQDGDDDPLERFGYTNTTGSTIIAMIDVANYNGLAAAKTLELFIYPSSGTIVGVSNTTSADSIFGHHAVPGVIAVGAIAANDPGNDTIEPFSSQGPVTIIGQGQRAKPDIAGIDCVSVTGAGGFTTPFCGTSAAAPHIAAIAAQLWGEFPSATGNQIKNHILNTGIDLGVAGADFVFGNGRADSLLSFQAGPAIISFNFAGLTPSVTGIINETNHTVALTVPFGTAVVALAPTIVITGASVSLNTGIAQDFTNPVIYTVTAASGLIQAYVVTVTVAPATTHTISGTVKYYDGIKVVPNATIILEDDAGVQLATTATDANGFYQFTEVVSGGDYVVRVEKSDNAAGLSSADQIKIGRHIVQLELFNTIYKTIAGDVNNSGGLTSADQIKIGRFIVQLDSNLPSGAWKFYSSEVAPTATNYLTNGLNRAYTDLIADMPDQDFVGIKMGDVNNSWINN